ncbi:long-chain-fatty-acid--CoA ligase 3-like [Eurytemora carolleeae]|uniref:long-chain-fatty-acid--CoA ligase 3-like n=1 Tax=Eurytemora carolleeae TaxID=1294199 RepID=UPI000C771353|nr:long-chain-fatty-acid--CoA ligase 3-like [Eurytemora carolleeae]|eukprot:XP_023345187.1 long-chain-fatty-acid--CoA ligase 3-like [Eurytemora affinis]
MVLELIKVLIRVWGLLFGWVYRIFNNSEQKVKNFNKVRANPLKKIEPGDTEVTYDPVKLETTPFIQEFLATKPETMADIWDWSVKRYREKRLLGTRDILGEEDEIQPNGKMFRKLELGDFR